MKRSPATKFIHILIAFLTVSILTTGCGKDQALETYRENMENYYDSLAIIDSGINAIDPQTDVDGQQLLGYLDQLNDITGQMAALEVPSQFSTVESLADEAAENMSRAVLMYHEFYESPEVNEEISAAAYEYYDRANLRIRYIREILHGQMPEELVVTDASEGDGSEGAEE